MNHLELTQTGAEPAQSARTIHSGNCLVPVTAGQTLKIETSPGGIEVLDDECPAGKVRSVYISVKITETDTYDRWPLTQDA